MCQPFKTLLALLNMKQLQSCTWVCWQSCSEPNNYSPINDNHLQAAVAHCYWLPTVTGYNYLLFLDVYSDGNYLGSIRAEYWGPPPASIPKYSGVGCRLIPVTWIMVWWILKYVGISRWVLPRVAQLLDRGMWLIYMPLILLLCHINL